MEQAVEQKPSLTGRALRAFGRVAAITGIGAAAMGVPMAMMTEGFLDKVDMHMTGGAAVLGTAIGFFGSIIMKKDSPATGTVMIACLMTSLFTGIGYSLAQAADHMNIAAQNQIKQQQEDELRLQSQTTTLPADKNCTDPAIKYYQIGKNGPRVQCAPVF